MGTRHPLVVAGLAVALAALLGSNAAGEPAPTRGEAARADAGSSLRFFGTGRDDVDRVKIRLDDPARPVDVGRTDFTMEVWLKARRAENPAPAVTCGRNVDWIYGHVVLDRDRYNRDRKFGLSIAGGRLVWGVSGNGTGDRTVCGSTRVTDNRWHHVAVDRRRSDGRLRIWVDGRLDAKGAGPGGNVSYPDGSVGGDFCDGTCRNDPFLVVGAEKHDAGPAYPSFAGWLDELRVSTTLRYRSPFTPRNRPFRTDRHTAGLYHFDDGGGTRVTDSSGASGGPSHGVRKLGGDPRGPRYVAATPLG